MNRRSLGTACRRGLLAMAALFTFSGALSARTITLTADDCDQMAVISEAEPRLSWAMMKYAPGIYITYNQVYLYPNMGILMRFPLDKIPKGQRITKAEFTVPTTYTAGVKQQISLRRLLVEWGWGVCHQYRVSYPKKIEWSKPGARGVTSDRSNKLSAIFKYNQAGEVTVDVTQDIELWYTGGEANRGWILTLDDENSVVYMPSPYPSGPSWKLQITYEPQ